MLVNEAAKLSGTTKKAIEYYCQKGLLCPAFSENGYRVFTAEDVECLKKISLLRSLGVSVEDIRDLLNRNDSAPFQRIIEERERELQKTKEQNELLKELAVSMDWNTVHRKAAAAVSRQSVTDRLVKAFPGFWGKSLAVHFGRFLQDPVRTAEQENAYREICEYLDGVQFEVPEELEIYLDEMNTEAGQEAVLSADAALSDAADDPENWLKNNQEIIEKYREFIQSAEYQSSPGAKLMELLRKFTQEQGYNTIFIPAMRRLSPAYDEYIRKLQKADQIYSQQYQE
ncbi:MAG: MerR family transcriptional regulator [Solobacterium sp.]|nr:MerR family transcriptional regulator [Solobacterium sp.]